MDVVCVARPMSPWLREAVIDKRCSTEETLYDIIRYVEDNLSIKQENQNHIFMVVLNQEDDFDQLLRKEGYWTRMEIMPPSVDFGMMKRRKQLI